MEISPAPSAVVDFDHHSGGKTPPPDPELAALAARQHGVVAHLQLLALGFTARQIERRLSSGRLHVVHRGVYAVGHRRLTRDGRWMAGVLACGPLAFLSHQDGGALWGIRRSTAARIHVTTLTGGRGRGRQDGLVVHQPRSLHPDDRAVVDGIPVTSVARTLLDLSEVITADALDRALETAERRQLFDLDAIDALLDRTRGRKGKRRLQRALVDYRPGPGWTRSDLEDEFLRLLRKAGLPMPAVNKWVAGHEVDCVWFEEKLIVELDGGGYHASTAARERDPQRDADLQLAGYDVIRITDRRLAREPEAVIATIRRLLAASR
jgi:very-short-patch-repair endonuclease